MESACYKTTSRYGGLTVDARDEACTTTLPGRFRFMRRAGRLFVFGLIAVCLAAAALPQGSNALQASPMPVPKEAPPNLVLSFQYWNGLMVIAGIVNGGGTERFTLLTGMNANAVSKEAYKNWQLLGLPSHVRVDILDTRTDAQEVEVAQVELRTLKLTKVKAAMLDVYPILSRAKRPDAPDVWLGMPFLSAFQATLDFTSQFLYLRPADSDLPKGPGIVVVPLTIRDGRIWVKVSAPPARPFMALVDTGTVGTLIPTEVAAKLKIAPVKMVTVSRQTGTQAKAGLVVLPKLNVGGAELKSVPAVFLASDAPPEFDTTMGILGLDFLRQYKVTIDVKKKKMVLAPLKSPDEKKPAPEEDQSASADN